MNPVEHSQEHGGHGHSHGGHGHGGHGHLHVPSADADRRWLAIALALIASFMGVEILVGLLADSLALLSDAAHMLTDAASLSLALAAATLVARPIHRNRWMDRRRGPSLAVTGEHPGGEPLERARWRVATAIRRRSAAEIGGSSLSRRRARPTRARTPQAR